MISKLYFISAVLGYMTAICTFITAGIGKNSVQLALVTVYMCIGSLCLLLYKMHKKHNHEDEK